jgi:hypothetical protein
MVLYEVVKRMMGKADSVTPVLKEARNYSERR